MNSGNHEPDNAQAPKWAIKPDINFGNVITLVAMIVAIVVGYTKLEARVESLSADIKTNTNRDELLIVQFNSLRDLSYTRQELITNKLSRIEAIMERVEKHQNAR